jgi:hypothetical protein
MIVESESRRALSEDQLRADPALIAEGWERRFVTDPSRLDEIVTLYEGLGYEVRAEPVRPAELGEHCDECELVSLLRFHTIYTRRR